MDEQSSTSRGNSGQGLLQGLPRPPFQLRSLPLKYRWEVTRRHPYYQASWESARACHRKEPAKDPLEVLARVAARYLLEIIGVSGEPPSPTCEFEDLEGGEYLQKGWLSGAVHPISLRGMAALLIAALPKETIGALGQFFLQAAEKDEENKLPRQLQSLMALPSLDKPGLDSYVDEPIVSINPAASAAMIADALGELLNRWKVERELTQRRDRSDKYDEYLQVWDLREGWGRGSYDRTKERHLRDIATELQMSLTTAHNHYRCAFELIVGHPYFPELWFRVMGPLKLSEFGGAEVGKVSRRRPSKSRTRRDVPESTVIRATVEDRGSGLIASSASDDSSGFQEIVNDIQSLVERGHTNDEIVSELELSPDVIPAIDYLRIQGFDRLRD